MHIVGIDELDRVLLVVLSTEVFIGGLLAFTLDNTIPGMIIYIYEPYIVFKLLDMEIRLKSFQIFTENPEWIIWALVCHHTDKKTHFSHIFESFCPCTDPLWLKWVKWFTQVFLCC